MAPQVMLAQGYANRDPRYRLSYLKISCGRWQFHYSDIRSATMNMSRCPSHGFNDEDAFQNPAEADGKYSSGANCHPRIPNLFVGTRMVDSPQAIRSPAKGKDFTLAEFHDRALDEGAGCPVPIFRATLAVGIEAQPSAIKKGELSPLPDCVSQSQNRAPR